VLKPQLLARSAGRSARWAVLQSLGKHGIDLLVFLCLARWVAPQAFGLVAMASSVVVLVTVLAEMGLGDALLQRAELRPDHADTAFWLALGVGAGLAGLLFVGASFAATAYGHAEVEPLLRALCPLFLIQALNVVPQALLQRELAFRPLALRALAGSVAGGLAGVLTAWLGGGAWSLLAQQLTAASVGLLGLWWQTSWRPRLRVSWASASELYGFSRHVLGARMLNVLASKADDVVVGVMLGPLALGFYSVACRLLLALEQVFCHGVDAVALSAFSRAGASREQMRDLFVAATRTAALWAFPVFGGAIVLAGDLVPMAVGPSWAPSVPLLQILLVAGLLQAVMHFNHAVFKACGRPEFSLRIAASSTALNVVTLAIAVQFGIVAVAVSYLVRAALIAPVGAWLACRLLGLSPASYLAGLLRPALGLGAAVAAVWLGQAFVPAISAVDLPVLARLAAQVAIGALGYGLCLKVCSPAHGFGNSQHRSRAT